MSQEPLSPRLTAWLDRRFAGHGFLLLLLVLIILTYNGIQYARFNYDDIDLIVGNPALGDWRQIGTVLQAGRAVRGLTLMADYSLWGLDAMGYHLTNLALHTASVMALYFLIFRLFGRKALAGLTAAFFNFHPVHTEAVIGITHRKEMLAMIFFCLAYLAFLERGRRRGALWLSLALFGLGLLSKQVVMALPLVLAADWWIRSEKPARRAQDLLPILPFVLLPGAALLWQLQDFRLFGRFQLADFGEAGYGQILATSAKAFVSYLRLSFFPMHLCLDRTVPLAKSFFEPGPLAGLALALGGAGLFFAAAKRWPVFAFGLAWYLLNLLPVMNLVPANAFLAERYLYIPSAGICLLGALALEHWATRAPAVPAGRAGSALEALLLVIFLCSFFVIGPRSFLPMIAPAAEARGIRPETALLLVGLVCAAGMAVCLLGLFRSAERGGWLSRRRWARDGLLPLLFLGWFTVEIGLIRWLALGDYSPAGMDVDRAYADWFAWLARSARPHRRWTDFVLPSGSLASELFNLTVFWVLADSVAVLIWRAMARYFGARAPNGGRVWMFAVALFLLNLGQVNQRIRDWGDELSLWKGTVRENPASFIGWNNLGWAYAGRNKLPEARAALERAYALRPDQANIAANLGVINLQLNDLPAAQRYFEAAVELEPTQVQARLNLGNCLSQRGRTQEAIAQYFEVLELDPGSAHAHYNLAVLYQELGQLDPARYHAGEALRLAPGYERAQRLLGELAAPAP